ncbi:CPCC family cysteine-rich protein [Actinoplanes siamensis]|uniref:CPCC family cysteine-rich protein n=1 Tax=Actinoplanes siamensis TaxID=1223317 RepID=UPI0019434961
MEADPNSRDSPAVAHQSTENAPVQDDLTRRRTDWLHHYVSLKNVIAAVRDAPYTCPCCGHATLSERGSYEICDECGWEDDGQDNHDSAVVRGGPNGGLHRQATVATLRRNGDSEWLSPAEKRWPTTPDWAVSRHQGARSEPGRCRVARGPDTLGLPGWSGRSLAAGRVTRDQLMFRAMA